jgi:hypothetical protein
VTVPDPFRARRCVGCTGGILHRVTDPQVQGRWVVAAMVCDDCQREFKVSALVRDWPEDLPPLGRHLRAIR